MHMNVVRRYLRDPGTQQLQSATLCNYRRSKEKLANISVILDHYYDIGPRLNQH
jgi:hypothetical protein